MRALLRRPAATSWLIAAVFSAVVLLAGSRDVFWTGDFYFEVYPAYIVLMHGQVGHFFDLLPGYSGFVTIVGAPAALLTGALGGHETMVYRFTAIPGLIALSAVGVAISGPARAAGNRAWPLFLLLGAGGALTFETLRAGHPEDLLATGAAIGAVLAARGGRTGWAAFLIVAAVVAKQSMVVAILPAAMAAPRGGLRIAVAGAIGTAVLVAVQTQVGGAVHGTITNTGLLFHPHQIFWPFGVPATPEFIAEGHGTRMGPEWLAPLTRPMIVGMSVAVSLAWWVRSGPRRNLDDVLGLLALVLILRCMIDPWNLVYYHLPLVAALAAWEARRGRDLPVLSVVVTAACWLTFVVYDARTGNGPFLAYLAWAVPLAVGLGIALLRPATAQAPARAARVGAPLPA
jgi:hypothetical protein